MKKTTATKARPQRKPKTALKAELTLTVHESPPVEGWMQEAVGQIFNTEKPLRVKLLLGAERQRLDYDSLGWSLVYYNDGRIDFWDRALQAVASMPASLLPPVVIEPAKRFKLEQFNEKSRRGLRISTEDEALGPLIHELVFGDGKALGAYAESLLRVLYGGPSSHARSGLPWQEVASAGLIVAGRTWREGSQTLLSEWKLENYEQVEVSDSAFEPPKSYRPYEQLLRKPRQEKPKKDKSDREVGVARSGLEGDPQLRALRLRDILTPDCMGSTRTGTMAATLHQDTLMVARNAVNLLSPLIGMTTIGATGWTVPWMSNMVNTVAINPRVPSAGLFALLRDPRAVQSGTRVGGQGLIDVMAWSGLNQRDAFGRTRTQREAADGTLAATLAAWGVAAPTDANLLAANGDLSSLSLVDQVIIIEACENAELGTLNVPLPPALLSPMNVGSITIGTVTLPPLYSVNITGITGTVDFTTLPMGNLVADAQIGSNGNIVVDLALPDITLSAMITRSLTGAGIAFLTIGAFGLTLAFPFLAPLIATLYVFSFFVLNNMTAVSAVTNNLMWQADIRFDFDPSTERLEPFVSVTSTGGTFVVTTRWVSFNLIANVIESFIAAFGNLFNLWSAILTSVVGAEIQKALRQNGVQFPVAGRQNELQAVGGQARSSAGSLLELSVALAPLPDITTQPYVTQVPISRTLEDRLENTHLKMRKELNPQLPTPAGAVLDAGTFAGMALSQNAINYYLFQQWLGHRFEVEITDPAQLANMYNSARQLFKAFPSRVRIWPASPPRAVVSVAEMARGGRPLLVYFDDVRICFAIPGSVSGGGPNEGVMYGGSYELSCSFVAPGTISYSWPWVFGVQLGRPLPVLPPSGTIPPPNWEPRPWEFVDLNYDRVMENVAPADLEKLVLTAAQLITSQVGIQGAQTALLAPPWPRLMVGVQEELVPSPPRTPPLRDQAIYQEIMGHRKSLYLLPVLYLSIFDMFDGSPVSVSMQLLLAAAGVPAPLPNTVRAMDAVQGGRLRDYLIPKLNLPVGP
jgi:hypothetical protein